MTNHLRDYAPNLKNLRRCKYILHRKIKIMRIANFSVILFLNVKYCEFYKPRVGPNILPMSRSMP